MHTEYTIIFTYPNGKKQYSAYPKKYRELADQKAKEAKAWYEKKNVKVEFYEIVYYGSSFHHSVKIW